MNKINSRDRAVSPIVGVILVVAITVILSAVVAGIVFDVGDNIDEEVQAGVTITVEHDPQFIDVQVTTLGNADHVNVTGDPYDHLEAGGSLEQDDLRELGVGDTVRIGESDLESDGQSGTVVAVAVADDRETLATSQDYDFN
ncbi:type IV pilin [Natrarchaeobius oligotrophus]|uniref:Type IV pilin n=1 Tax=Natrarchaeobius chitinivorans TaxID=1679083 RepID=A0A3N6NM14_NATCH|nr:type IV pilin N-terminal domain-containing protein [Natrarchaeobius chitinivorans]RQH00423.1 type IV pilin [Natrarchaeobius chitinivorans]